MSSATPHTGPTGDRPGDVELTVPATTEQLSPVTAVAADLGLRADMVLDDLADLRLAVAEACAILAAEAPAGERLHCSFWVNDHGVEMVARVRSRRSPPTDGDGFSQRVLSTLTDLVEWSTEPGSDRTREPYIRIRLRKQV